MSIAPPTVPKRRLQPSVLARYNCLKKNYESTKQVDPNAAGLLWRSFQQILENSAQCVYTRTSYFTFLRMQSSLFHIIILECMGYCVKRDNTSFYRFWPENGKRKGRAIVLHFIEIIKCQQAQITFGKKRSYGLVCVSLTHSFAILLIYTRYIDKNKKQIYKCASRS